MAAVVVAMGLHKVGDMSSGDGHDEKKKEDKNMFLKKIKPVCDMLTDSFDSMKRDLVSKPNDLRFTSYTEYYESNNTSEQIELWFVGDDSKNKVAIGCKLKIELQKSQINSNDENINVSVLDGMYNYTSSEIITFIFGESTRYTGKIKDFTVTDDFNVMWKKMLFVLTLTALAGKGTIKAVTSDGNNQYEITIRYKGTIIGLQNNYITIQAKFTNETPLSLVKVTHIDSWNEYAFPGIQQSKTPTPGNEHKMKTVKEFTVFIIENKMKKPIKSVLIDLNNVLDIYLNEST